MSIELMLGIGGFIVVVGGLIFNAGNQKGRSEQIETNLNFKIDQHIKDDDIMHVSLKAQVQRQWDWKDQHEREASTMRLDLQKQIGKIEAGLTIHDSHYAEILRVVQSMSQSFESKMEKLEESLDSLRKN